MKNQFSIDFEWLSQDTSSPDDATFAALSITINDTSATEVEDVAAKTVRKSIRVSANRFAEWILTNWWRLRWEPENNVSGWMLSHNVGAVAGGFAWPNLDIYGDGQDVWLNAQSARPTSCEPIRYLNNLSECVPADAFERVVDTFIAAVIERLRSCGLVGTPLEVLWSDLKYERTNDEIAVYRKFEALLGYDADEGPEGVIERLLGFTREYGVSAIEEIALVERDQAPEIIDSLRMAASRAVINASINSLSAIQKEIPKDARRMTPWGRGAIVAEIARRAWNLGATVPIRNEQLSGLLNVPSSALDVEASEDLPFSVALRTEAPDQLCISLDKRRITGRRFALARLLGDHIWSDAQERLLPATDVKSARQQYQRAFAQEFLSPFSGLREFLSTDTPKRSDVDAAARHFSVSPLLVGSALVNRGVLSRSFLDEFQHE